MPRTTRAFARAQRTALLRSLIMGEHGFSSCFNVLLFEQLGLDLLRPVASVCKHLKAQVYQMEEEWELLIARPKIIRGLHEPLCVTVAPDGHSPIVGSWNWATKSDALTCITMDNAGKPLPIKTIAQHGDEPGQVRIANSLACDGSKYVYVCDRGNARIQKLKYPSGKFVSSYDLDCHSLTLENVDGPSTDEMLPESVCWCSGSDELFVGVSLYHAPCGSLVIVLDGNTMTWKREFGRGELFEIRDLTVHDGHVYICEHVSARGLSMTEHGTLDRDGCIAVYTVAGARVRTIHLECALFDKFNRPGHPTARLRPCGVAVVRERLVVCSDKYREPEDEDMPWYDDLQHLSNPENHEGELQVLTLEGSLRQAIVRPCAMQFGGMGVGVDPEGGHPSLFLTDRGCIPNEFGEGRLGSLFIFSAPP